MICPSCTFHCAEGGRYCGRCRMRFSAVHFHYARFQDHLYWVFRRANAGFIAGMVAWFFIPALSRVISNQAPPILHFCIQGILGGAFLGTVEGMLEESSSKTFRGAVLGGLGGAFGGAIFGAVSPQLTPEQTGWGIFGLWACTGMCIGLVGALWERQFEKIVAGGLSGLIGGGVGGALGYGVYAYLIDEFTPEGWFMRRLCEGFSGGIIGVTLWFAIAWAERLIVFKRRSVGNHSHKTCDHCSSHNPLNTWYCSKCGSVLQEAAAPASLNLSPFTTLDRLRDFFKYLSRLSSTTGVIAGLVVFIVFFPVNKMLAFVAAVLVGLISYTLLLLFASISESLQIWIKKQP